MKLYVIRHGETDWNVRRLFQGQVNTDINEHGIEQAKEAKERIEQLGLCFDHAISSPIRRAVHTLEIITGLPAEEIHTDDRLKEMNFGPLDNTPFDKESPLAGKLFSDPENYIPPMDAESYDDLRNRLHSFLDDIKAQHPGNSIIAGCHGCAMRLLMVELGEYPLNDIWKHGVGNCTIIETTLLDEAGNETDSKDGTFKVTNIYETQDVNWKKLQHLA